MSEKFEPDFYTVKHAGLAELLEMARTADVQEELEKRAAEKLREVFEIYKKAFADNAPEKFSDDAARLFQ